MRSRFRVLWCLTAFVLAAALHVSASTTRTKYRYGVSFFQNEWENMTRYYNNGTEIGYMVWGYDTDWTDEDYVWTNSYSGKSQAQVFQDGYDTS